MGKPIDQDQALAHQIERLILENAQLREKEQLHRQGENRLRQQISDDTLLAHIATGLLSATNYPAISEALQQFSNYLDLSRCCLLHHMADSSNYACLAQTTSNIIKPVKISPEKSQRIKQQHWAVISAAPFINPVLAIGFTRNQDLLYLLILEQKTAINDYGQRLRDLGRRIIHQLVNTHLRIQLESEKQSQEELLAMVMEASSDAYFDWHPEKGEVHYSDQLWYMLGYKPGEFTNTPYNAFALMHADDRERVYNMFKQALSSGKGYSTELHAVDKEGNDRWLRAKTKVFKQDDAGNTARLVGSLSDITELKNSVLENIRQANTQTWLLKAVRDLFNQSSIVAIEMILVELLDFLKASQTGFLILDEANDHLRLIYKTDDQGLIIKPDQTVALSSLPELDLTQHQQLTLTGSDSHPLLSIAKPNHENSSLVITPLSNKGHLLGYLVIEEYQPRDWQTDELYINQIIADSLAMVWLKQGLSRDLSKSRERFDYAMETSADGISDWNLEKDEIYLSPGFFSMLGMKDEQKTYNANFIEKMIYKPDSKMFFGKFSHWLNSGKDFIAIQGRLIRPDGNTVWALLRSKVVNRNINGKPSRIVSVITDISDFKQVQTKLEKARKNADVANKAKSEFLARMSHEIRTPINAIQGLSHLLLDSQLDDQQEDFLHDINNAASSLLGIINDILDFSKIEAGKLNLDNHAFNLPSLVEKTLKWLSISADKKSLPIRLILDKRIPSWLIGDASRINQILVNLLGNAIKFTEKGEILVEVKLQQHDKKHADIQFSITDSGIGIDDNLAKKLFDPFSQADGSSSRKYGGTGLGLAICNQLAEHMGGQLTFSSTLGTGSCFTLSLTLEIADEITSAIQPDIKDEPLPPLNVLLVEDNIVNQKVAQGMLNKLKATVTTVNNGLEALSTLVTSEQQPDSAFDLILMDIEMPELDGYDTTRQIRQGTIRPDIPIVAMTAHAMSGDREKSLASGMNEYITKPIKLEALENALRFSITL